VVVDLHLGPSEVIVPLSEQLVGHVIDEQLAQFTKGKDVPRVQVMVEEAHNLFGADAYREGAGVWVKLAKEASKLRIGLIYATQEVTGVAHQVLANTKNWVVAHLNNTKELRELSKFYDFEAHAASIVKAEDKGYVRLKTMSSPYIVPVQIDRYGPDLVNEARAAAGESPLSR
jgi:DNA helicase HerA-like ATPase